MKLYDGFEDYVQRTDTWFQVNLGKKISQLEFSAILSLFIQVSLCM